MTDLTEEVARALQDAFPAIGFKKAALDAAAQAAIAIVLERAAEVACSYVGDRIGLKTGAKLEDAILALKPEAQS